MKNSNPNAKALGLYLKCWRLFWRHTILGVLFSLSLALQRIILPLLVALLLGQLIHQDTISYGLLIATGVFEVLIVSSSYLLDRYGVAALHDQISEKLYDDTFRYLVRQDYSFFANNFSGSIVTQASRFSKVYTTFNDTMFFELLPQLFSVLLALGIVFHYTPWLAVVVLAVWLFAIWVVVKLALQRLPWRRAAVAKESEQVGELADMITNSLTVKTFAAEDRETQRYGIVNKARGKLFLRSWHRAVRNAWLVEVICAVLQLGVLISGIYMVKYGTIGVATFLLFQVYALRIIESISRSVHIARQLEMVTGDGQEMAELLDQPPTIQDKPDAKDVKIKGGAIALNNVTFQYPDTARQKDSLFDNFNLDIKAGQRVGLVGPSGGGKTTITRLLLRFVDIQGGSIKVDNHDIRDITQTSLRRAMAYVPQEPLLFHRSIKQNIAYGKPNASQDEIIEVAKKAFAHDFIKDLPEGYDTLVGERGVKLSGGQRQRVAIARAMLSDSPILILDEATSALDSESEKSIQKALWQLMKGRTAVVIAHRLSTIQRMDRIVVIDKGIVIEDGSHQELLDQNGLYARLWSHQSGGFLES